MASVLSNLLICHTDIIQVHVQKSLSLHQNAILKCVSKAFSFLLEDTFLLERASQFCFVLPLKEDKPDLEVFKRLFPIVRQGLKDLPSHLNKDKGIDFKLDPIKKIKKPNDSKITSPIWIREIIRTDQYLFLKTFIEHQLDFPQTVDLPTEWSSQLCMTSDNLDIIFEEVAIQGSLQSLKMMVEKIGADNRLRSVFGQALVHIASYGYLDCLQFLFTCKEYRDEEATQIQRAFISTARYGHLECLQAFLKNDQFDDISDIEIANCCSAAIKGDHPDCLLAIIQHPKFNLLTLPAFKDLTGKAVVQGSTGCLKNLVVCKKFTEFDAEAIQSIFVATIQANQVGCLQVILECNRFDDIAVNVLTAGCFLAAENCFPACLQAIIDCRRFNEMDPSQLRLVFDKAKEHSEHSEMSKLIPSFGLQILQLYQANRSNKGFLSGCQIV